MSDVRMIDMVDKQIVEVLVDANGRRIWVNVDGICVFRCCNIKVLTIEDLRAKPNE